MTSVYITVFMTDFFGVGGLFVCAFGVCVEPFSIRLLSSEFFLYVCKARFPGSSFLSLHVYINL